VGQFSLATRSLATSGRWRGPQLGHIGVCFLALEDVLQEVVLAGLAEVHTVHGYGPTQGVEAL
jgi:hypothetical protein